MPTVSVVVPCYNGGKFLDQLVANLAQQTFRDFEIVIINDGSTDPLTKAKLSTLDPAIRVVHQENRGLSGARNRGYSESRAEFVAYLDCDDLLDPTYVEECLNVLQSAPPDVGFVFTHVRMLGARQGIRKNCFNVFDALFKNVIGGNKLTRKTAWQRAGGYDEGMRDGYEDWDFNLRLIRAGYRGIEIPKPLYIYNASTQGMMMGRSSRMHAELWRRIRNKHSDLYRISNLVRSFRETRAVRSEVSLFTAVAALVLTHILPDSWYSAIVHSIRRYRWSRSSKSCPSTVPGPAIRADISSVK